MKMMDKVPSAHIYECPYVPLEFSRLVGVTDHAKAFVGTVNTASLNLTVDQRGSIEFRWVFLHDLLHLNLSGGTLSLH